MNLVKHFEKNKTFYGIGVPITLGLGGLAVHYKFIHLPALEQAARIAKEQMAQAALIAQAQMAQAEHLAEKALAVQRNEGWWNRTITIGCAVVGTAAFLFKEAGKKAVESFLA